MFHDQNHHTDSASFVISLWKLDSLHVSSGKTKQVQELGDSCLSWPQAPSRGCDTDTAASHPSVMITDLVGRKKLQFRCGRDPGEGKQIRIDLVSFSHAWANVVFVGRESRQDRDGDQLYTRGGEIGAADQNDRRNRVSFPTASIQCNKTRR